MAGPRVPEFGKWENQSVPYTAYFETARKGRKGGKIINPNDPTVNLDLFSDTDSQGQAPSYGTKESMGSRPGSRHKQLTESHLPYRVYGESPSHYRQYAESPTRHNAGGGRGADAEPTNRYRGGSRQPSNEAQRRNTRSSAGSESSYDSSPLQQQARSPGRGVGAPTYGNRQGNPELGASRMKPVNNSPKRDTAVPMFGEWNKGTPPPGNGYTEVFEKVRRDKKDEVRNQGVPMVKPAFTPSNNTEQKPTSDKSSKVCCVPWRRK